MSWGAKQTGADTLAVKLQDMKALAGDEVAVRALTAGGQLIASAARGFTRSRSGRLRDSITVGTELSPSQASQQKVGEVYIGPGSMPEAITEEFGTVHEAPHPFLRPAWDAEQGAALQTAAEIYSNECARIAGS